MTLFCKVGQIQITAGTGNMSISGLGWQPKLIIMWTTYQTATGIVDGAKFAIGWSDGTNHRCESIQSVDNSASSDAERMTGNVLLRVVTDGSGTEGLRLTFVSFDSGGVTFNKNINASGTNVYVNYLVMGGTDITNVAAGVTALNTTTGNQAFTGPGFQPDIVFMMGDGGTSSGLGNSNTGMLNIGAAISSSKRGVVGVNSENARATMDTWRILRSDRCMVLTDGNGALEMEADHVSMDANGFTLNIIDAPAAASSLHWLAIKGARWDIGKFAITSGTSNQSVGSRPFQPSGLILLSDQSATDNPSATESHNQLVVGMATSTSERIVTNYADEDNVADSETANSMLTTGVLRFLATNVNATGSSTTVDLDCDLASFDSAGFTLTKPTNTGSQLGQVLFVMFAPTIYKNTGETEEISELLNYVRGRLQNTGETEQVSEAVNAILGHIKTTNETAQISEAINKILGLARNAGDTEQILETINTALGLAKTANDTQQIQEAINAVLGRVKRADDEVGIQESVIKIITSMVQAVTTNGGGGLPRRGPRPRRYVGPAPKTEQTKAPRKRTAPSPPAVVETWPMVVRIQVVSVTPRTAIRFPVQSLSAPVVVRFGVLGQLLTPFRFSVVALHSVKLRVLSSRTVSTLTRFPVLGALGTRFKFQPHVPDEE